jgi:hypothetical protein
MKWRSENMKYRGITKAKWAATKLHLTVKVKNLELDLKWPKFTRDPWGMGSHMGQSPHFMAKLSKSEDEEFKLRSTVKVVKVRKGPPPQMGDEFDTIPTPM